jgi:hypothetical protein
MTNYITFTDAMQSNGIALEPIPASSLIPEWYKKTESYLNKEKVPNGKGGNNSTIKRCMPVFDAIVSGYLLLLPADVYVSFKEEESVFQWSDFDLISFHPLEQGHLHPVQNGNPFPKFINPWAIKTPKGYSTLFTHPMHHALPFTTLPGVVDTDKYTAPVNIIFALNDPKWEGLIPKGTPIAQVIPFKRENWKKNIGGQKELEQQFKVSSELNTKFFDRYKNMFRSHKEYK